jgi:hypothetical protein
VRTHDWRLRQHSGRRSLVMPLLGYASVWQVSSTARAFCVVMMTVKVRCPVN